MGAADPISLLPLTPPDSTRHRASGTKWTAPWLMLHEPWGMSHAALRGKRCAAAAAAAARELYVFTDPDQWFPRPIQTRPREF
eukprot:7879156-Pyramimonas_sp.AAC.1